MNSIRGNVIGKLLHVRANGNAGTFPQDVVENSV
jgi:hypothetical protein